MSRPVSYVKVRTELINNPELSTSECLLLSDMWGFDSYFKARKKVAEQFGWSASYVRRMLCHLEGLKYIEVERMRGNTKIYRITKKTRKSMEKAMKYHKDNSLDGVVDLDAVKRGDDDIFVEKDAPNGARKKQNNKKKTHQMVREDAPNGARNRTKWCVPSPILNNNKLQLNNNTQKNQEEEITQEIKMPSRMMSQTLLDIFLKAGHNVRVKAGLRKRPEVIRKFQESFSDEELVEACEILATMKPLQFDGDNWRVSYSWLVSAVCLSDESAFDKRVMWLERALSDDVEPDSSGGNLEKWAEWKKRHKK